MRHNEASSRGDGRVNRDSWERKIARRSRGPSAPIVGKSITEIRVPRLEAVLRKVRAFATVSASTDYGDLLRRIRVEDAGIADAWLFVPSRSASAPRVA